ncbi:hypothetical protein ACSNOI_42885 [Actinomadura kijaniata]|uniref:hypothetical protein n=1 Tax=Actinomadura kijaniata TaxID=46161 RepID=UPI003F1A9DA6
MDAVTGLRGFARRFAAEWATPLTEGDGFPAEELDAAEARLGVRLPGALREAYRLFGRRADLTSNHDTLLAPSDLYVLDGALVFRSENQGAANWGVPLADAGLADPPAFVRADLADKSAERWEPWLDGLTRAVEEMLLSEALHASEDLCDGRDLEDDDVERLERAFTARPDLPAPWGRWFTGPDLMIRVEGDDWLSVRARTGEALDRFRDDHDGDWVNA